MISNAKFISNTVRKVARFILFGNYYLGFCIVALSFETTLKNNFTIDAPFYYLSLFLSVVVYYTHAYISDSILAADANPRSQWYFRNRKTVIITQVIYTVFLASVFFIFIVRHHSSFEKLPFSNLALLLIFPVTAMLYYGVVFPGYIHIRLRNIAWLKPFLIGFVCSGVIVIYPFIFHALQQGQTFHLSLANALYFFTNWLFTTAIAIMFDIKDFVADHNYQLKTFVVKKGLRFTIFFVLLPLSIASFLSFVAFAILKQFSFGQMTINVIPFILLLYASTSLTRRRSILYYLIIIDGLLLVKALFGIITMTLLT